MRAQLACIGRGRFARSSAWGHPEHANIMWDPLAPMARRSRTLHTRWWWWRHCLRLNVDSLPSRRAKACRMSTRCRRLRLNIIDVDLLILCPQANILNTWQTDMMSRLPICVTCFKIKPNEDIWFYMKCRINVSHGGMSVTSRSFRYRKDKINSMSPHDLNK